MKIEACRLKFFYDGGTRRSLGQKAFEKNKINIFFPLVRSGMLKEISLRNESIAWNASCASSNTNDNFNIAFAALSYDKVTRMDWVTAISSSGMNGSYTLKVFMTDGIRLGKWVFMKTLTKNNQGAKHMTLKYRHTGLALNTSN